MGRRTAAIAVLALLCAATAGFAQTARAFGSVRDTEGKAIKGATIRATNPEAYPPQVVSATDDRGRWAMLGLRIGTYTFTVEAPGFAPVQGSAAVRTAASPPMVFTMARDPGPIPGSLPSNIQAQLSAANMLRDQGRVDQALASYQEIHAKNPKLTSVQLVIASMYRQRAAQESDVQLRRGLLERAIEAYSDYLKSDAGNERAQHELELTRAEIAPTR